MRAVVTRVSFAKVEVNGELISEIGSGLLVLLGAEEGDTDDDIRYITDKIINLRIFEDDAGKLNLSLLNVGGEILAVSQFTLLGDARKGRRPSFIKAGSPELSRELYEKAVASLKGSGLTVKTGIYQAEMRVTSANEGPVTILLDSRKVF